MRRWIPAFIIDKHNEVQSPAKASEGSKVLIPVPLSLLQTYKYIICQERVYHRGWVAQHPRLSLAGSTDSGSDLAGSEVFNY